MRWFLFSTFLIVAFALVAFLYFATSTFPYQKPPTPQVIKDLVSMQDPSGAVLQPAYIDYVLYELGAYQLHLSPGGKDLPRIAFIVGEKTFSAEVSEGKVHTQEGMIDKPDIRITTSREEIIQAIRSGLVKEYLKKSIADGKTHLEQVASYPVLFSKGYLNLYQELTGKSLTGNIIRIFSDGK